MHHHDNAPPNFWPFIVVGALALLSNAGFGGIIEKTLELLFGIGIFAAQIAGTLVWHLILPVIGLVVSARFFLSIYDSQPQKILNLWSISVLSLSCFLGMLSAAYAFGFGTGLFLALIGVTKIEGWSLIAICVPFNIAHCGLLFLSSWQAGSSVTNQWAKCIHCIAFYATLALIWICFENFYPDNETLKRPASWEPVWALIELSSVSGGYWLARNSPPK